MRIKTLSVTFKYKKPEKKPISAHDEITRSIKEELRLEQQQQLSKREDKANNDQVKAVSKSPPNEKTPAPTPAPTPTSIQSPELQRIVSIAHIAQDKKKSFSELYSNDLTQSLAQIRSYTIINNETESEWLQNSTDIAQTLLSWRHLYKLLDQRKRQIKRELREGDRSGDQEDETSDNNEEPMERDFNVPKTRGGWRGGWRGGRGRGRGRGRGKRRGFK